MKWIQNQILSVNNKFEEEGVNIEDLARTGQAWWSCCWSTRIWFSLPTSLSPPWTLWKCGLLHNISSRPTGLFFGSANDKPGGKFINNFNEGRIQGGDLLLQENVYIVSFVVWNLPEYIFFSSRFDLMVISLSKFNYGRKKSQREGWDGEYPDWSTESKWKSHNSFQDQEDQTIQEINERLLQ